MSQNKELTEEETIWAVVIAGNVDNRLQPCTLYKSRALLPLANKPVIDYTLSFVAASGIKDVIVYCNNANDGVKSHVESDKWKTVFNRLQVLVLEDSLTAGDVLRDLDDKHLVSSDFVLLHGDLVANFDLKASLEAHRKTREEDKDAILTTIMKKCPPNHKMRDLCSTSLYALNKTTNQILHHQKTMGEASKIKLPMDLIRENKELRLRYDLLDCHVTLCSPVVPSLLTDNFDYQTISDLIHGVLGNQEILGNTMHVYEIDEGYAACITSPHTYKVITQDVMERWTAPFTPDVDFTPGDVCYKYSFGNKYVAPQLKLSKLCSLRQNVVIGSDTEIGEGTKLKNSVVGRNCKIGNNVSIENSILWDDVVVESGCTVTNSIFCNRVKLLQNTKLIRLKDDEWGRRGSDIDYMLGAGVVLGPDVTITEEVKLVEEPQDDGFDSEPSKEYPNRGTNGKAYEYFPDSDTESDNSDRDDLRVSDESDEDDDHIRPDTELFFDEVIELLTRVTTENIQPENIILDINSLKHAYNIQINEVNHLLIQTALDYPIRKKQLATAADLLKDLRPLLKQLLPVFKNYYRSQQSQKECLEGMQVITQVLMFFYQSDLLEEEVITDWYDTLTDNSQLKREVKKLVEWFEEAEEDSESD